MKNILIKLDKEKMILDINIMFVRRKSFYGKTIYFFGNKLLMINTRRPRRTIEKYKKDVGCKLLLISIVCRG